MNFWLRFKAASQSRSVFKPGCLLCFWHQQEQEGKKLMEPRSEDEEVTVQQLPQVKHTHV